MINIIGAGPVGCFLAYKLSNEDIKIFEEHSDIGKPVQCTGIVTNAINDILKVRKDTIINKIDKARIYSSKNKFVEIKFKDKNLILDREKFDKSLAEEAKDKGVRIIKNSKLISVSKDYFIVKQGNKFLKIKISKKDYLIGADGSLSIVSRYLNPYKRIKLFTGLQAIVKIRNDNIVDFFPSISKIAWIVPENEYIARVGIASDTLASENFKRFLDYLNIKNNQIVEKQAGLIPLYNSKLCLQKNNFYIAGDAATFVKATTFGGIIQGLISSKLLSESIIKNEDYTKKIKKNLRKELWIHLKIRKVLDNFQKKEYDELIDIFNDKRIKKLLETHNRDNLREFIFRLLLIKPKLLSFAPYLLY